MARAHGGIVGIQDFVAARRALLRWMCARKIALQIVDLEFPKWHAFRRSVEKLCGANCEFRYRADLAVCKYADRVGDDRLRLVVDGVYLKCGPLDYYYGDTLQQAVARRGIPNVQVSAGAHRNKTLNLRDIARFHSLAPCAQEFLEAVKPLLRTLQLSPAAARALTKREQALQQQYGAMVAKLARVPVDHRDTVKILLCLSRVGLTGDLGRAIIGFFS